MAIFVLVAGGLLSLLALANGYLWGANPLALPLVGATLMLPPATLSALIFTLGWAIFAEPPG
ncbi:MULTISPECIES: hypothetical protein [unclassified Phenylobacterium]|uniref:hypothetical protein n=1 Tax=unclassified Phenylobacterium TaxID=2640670 RepID=UPI00083B0B6E|nr:MULTISPECIES: hypothetical protein [unclassified Phenylobacterium]